MAFHQALVVNLVFAILLSLVIMSQGKVRRWFQQRHEKKHRDRIQRHRNIVAFIIPKVETRRDRLAVRAAANVRLKEAFRILNSFTTTDEETHARFLESARQVINDTVNGSWADLSIAANDALRVTANHFETDHTFASLASVVRVFVFIFMLKVLFDVNTTEVNLNNAQIATDAINDLWQESKDRSKPVSENRQNQLENALFQLLPGHDKPLNLIIPAYETMWRIVLLTFIAVAYRGVDRVTAEGFWTLLESVPRCLEDMNRFRREYELALTFVKEGFRLYPPTRRIYRMVSEAVLAADVEACHRDRVIWGKDALRFKPARFNTLTDDMERAYMPFGIGNHQCPASRRLSYPLVILLVVTLEKRFGTFETGLHLRDGDAELSRDLAIPLPYGRDDVNGWIIKLK